MPYLYETHLHTLQGSGCAIISGSDYIKRYLDLGYTGIFVTDHFFTGNTAVDRSLKWKAWVEAYCRGYEDAAEEGYKLGLDVFFGIEHNFQGDEYLIYGLDKDYLINNPGILKQSRSELYGAVKKQGGCVIHAHPFRERAYIRAVNLLPDFVDGIEAANLGNPPEQDRLAQRYAAKLGLPSTAGSDIHSYPESKSNVLGVWLDEKIKSAKDFANALKSGNVSPLIPEDRKGWTGNERITAEVSVFGEDDKIISNNAFDYL